MTPQEERVALVVGGFGSLGSAIGEMLRSGGHRVLSASRSARPGGLVLSDSSLADLPKLDVVCWAQGANVNDSVESYADADLDALLEANVTSVARQLRGLLAADRIRDGASLIVISSIWERLARPGKFSYIVTKAAVGGLVRAAAMDLAARGISVNGVLPGVVDTQMTRSVLTEEQISRVESATGHGRLVTTADIANTVASLIRTRGITGQSVVVDLGYSLGRVI